MRWKTVTCVLLSCEIMGTICDAEQPDPMMATRALASGTE